MKFLEMVEVLQQEDRNKNKIILVKCGVFFVAIGRDAILLHKILGLNVTCIKPSICKVGIPIQNCMKYTDKLEKNGYGYILYDYNSKTKKIEESKYIDRIVHRWYVDNFIKEYFVKSFISTSYACLENKGMHKACIDVQNTMKHCRRIWSNYYIIKMDVAKYFQNIDKKILYKLLERKIKDKKLQWLTKEILYSNGLKNGIPIR